MAATGSGARRAHELYIQRGSEPGKDVEDWYRAEREIEMESELYGPVSYGDWGEGAI